MRSASGQPQLLYSVPSLGFDESNGPPTLVFVTHQLALDRFPYTFAESSGFFITNGWLGRPGVYQQNIEILNPEGNALAESGQRSLELTGDSDPYMAVTFFMGVTFTTSGEHTIVVSLDGQTRTAYPLHLVQLGQGRKEISGGDS